MQVALVTPSFNRAATLTATLQSVAAQTGEIDLRYVVIDGGSTDATLDILKAHDTLIDEWVSEPDNGMYDAIAKGFARSGGEVLGWLNSDDTLFPWAIDTVSRIFRDIPEIQWLTTLTQTAIDAAGDVMYFRKVPGYAQHAFFDGVCFGFGGDGSVYSTDFIQQESTFFRRSLWEKVGAQALTSRKLAGDFALWTAFMAEAPLVAVDTPLGAFRVHSGSQLSRGKREQYVFPQRHDQALVRAVSFEEWAEYGPMARADIIDIETSDVASGMRSCSGSERGAARPRRTQSSR
jgi:glycosyltransferase involved in cell wall biosynthesis